MSLLVRAVLLGARAGGHRRRRKSPPAVARRRLSQHSSWARTGAAQPPRSQRGLGRGVTQVSREGPRAVAAHSVAALAPGGSSLGGGRRTVAAAGGRWRRPESGETMTKSTAIVITMLDMLERPANKRGPTWLTAQKGSAQTSSPHTAVLSGFRSGPKWSGILRPSPVSEESAPEGRNKLFCMHLRCRLRRSIAASDHLCRAHAVSQGFARET